MNAYGRGWYQAAFGRRKAEPKSIDRKLTDAGGHLRAFHNGGVNAELVSVAPAQDGLRGGLPATTVIVIRNGHELIGLRLNRFEAVALMSQIEDTLPSSPHPAAG